MDFSTVFPIILKVFTNRIVLIAVIAVVLYLNFVTYVQHYTKKAPPVRKAVKKAVAAQSEGEKKAEGESGSAEGNSNSDSSAADKSE